MLGQYNPTKITPHKSLGLRLGATHVRIQEKEVAVSPDPNELPFVIHALKTTLAVPPIGGKTWAAAHHYSSQNNVCQIAMASSD